jgi:hypothetical protein
MDQGARPGTDPFVPELVVSANEPRTIPSVFGFSVTSAVPLQFLRSGGGVDPLEVVTADEAGDEETGEPLGEWPLQGTAYPAHARLFRIPSGYDYWTSDAGRFRVDLLHGRIEVPLAGDPLLREQRLHGMPMILSFLSRGDISLHAAAVEIGSGAVVLAAPSRYGKSTLAMAFQKAGHRVLSEDLICCRPATGEALPGPALLRIRPDVYGSDLPQGLFVAAERPERVFLGFDATSAGSGAPVPITAIAFLREASDVSAQPADPVTALKDLWRLSFRTGTEEGRSDSFRNLARLAGSIPSWDVSRPLTLAALEPTVDIIRNSIGR